MSGFDDLLGPFQPKPFYDSMILDEKSWVHFKKLLK